MTIDRSKLSTRARNFLINLTWPHEMTDDEVVAFLQDRTAALREPGMGPKTLQELRDCFCVKWEGPRCGNMWLGSRLRQAEEALDSAERRLAFVRAEHDAIREAVLAHMASKPPTP